MPRPRRPSRPPEPPAVRLVAAMPAVPAGARCCLAAVVSNRSGHAAGRGPRSSREQPGLLWLDRLYDRPSLAEAAGAALVDAGQATLSFVVGIDGDTSTVLVGSTHPASAARIIGHYEELWDSVDPPGPE